MRPSASVHSGMPTGKTWMGWWGDLGGPKQVGISSYVVSPYRQAPMRGAVQHWVTRGYKRLAQQAMYFAIPIGAGYALISWSIDNNHLRNTKKGQSQGLFP